MDEEQTTQAGTPDRPAAAIPQEHAKIGPVLGIIIIISLFVLGGLYYWGAKLNDAGLFPSAEEIRAQPDELSDDLSSQGASDDITTIEADLEATNLNDIDQELEVVNEER
jgi:hypothetical protein